MRNAWFSRPHIKTVRAKWYRWSRLRARRGAPRPSAVLRKLGPAFAWSVVPRRPAWSRFEAKSRRVASAAQARRDLRQRRQLADRPDRRDGQRPGEKARPGGPDLVDRDGVDLGDDLLARDDAAPGEKLAGVALDPTGRALEGREQRHLELRLGARDLGLVDVGDGGASAVERHLDELDDVGGGGAG